MSNDQDARDAAEPGAPPEAAEPTAGALRFTATIYRVSLNYCVDVPVRVSRALGGRGAGHDRGYLPITGTADGHALHTTLVPRGGGRHRLFLNADVRAKAGAGEGDRVTVVLARDAASRESPLPLDLRHALRELRGALGVFGSFTAAQRRSMIAFVDGAKRAETRARRIDRLVEHVRERLPR